jgi:hypothetical protein
MPSKNKLDGPTNLKSGVIHVNLPTPHNTTSSMFFIFAACIVLYFFDLLVLSVLPIILMLLVITLNKPKPSNKLLLLPHGLQTSQSSKPNFIPLPKIKTCIITEQYTHTTLNYVVYLTLHNATKIYLCEGNYNQVITVVTTIHRWLDDVRN